MKKVNPYNFMHFSFIKDCLLFGKREPFFIRLGVFTWLAILCFIALFTTVIILVYQYNTL